MSRLSLVILLMLSLLSCNNEKRENSNSDSLLILKNRHFDNKIDTKLILGRWGDLKDTTSLFSVDKSEIYYYDALSSYKYKVRKDTLIIYYTYYTDTSLIKSVNKNILIIEGLGKSKGLNDTVRRFSK